MKRRSTTRKNKKPGNRRQQNEYCRRNPREAGQRKRDSVVIRLLRPRGNKTMDEADKAIEYVQLFFQRCGRALAGYRSTRRRAGRSVRSRTRQSALPPRTSSTAANGRGTRSASSLLAAGPSMTPTTKAATTGNRTSRPTYRTKPTPIVARIASDQVEISRRGSLGIRSGISCYSRDCSRTPALAHPCLPPRRVDPTSTRDKTCLARKSSIHAAICGASRRTAATYSRSVGSTAPDGPEAAARARSGGRPSRPSSSPNSSVSFVRARLRRLLMVPTSTPQMAAASS